VLADLEAGQVSLHCKIFHAWRSTVNLIPVLAMIFVTARQAMSGTALSQAGRQAMYAFRIQSWCSSGAQ
jgi:hypothetical protein